MAMHLGVHLAIQCGTPQETIITPLFESIVVAEDDEDFRKLLTTVLRWDGHDIIEFGDGEHLADYLLTSSPRVMTSTLVLADIVLPGITGLVACRRARAADCQCSFVFMSTFNDDATLTQALELGPLGILRKPFEIEALRGILGPLCSVSAPRVRAPSPSAV